MDRFFLQVIVSLWWKARWETIGQVKTQVLGGLSTARGRQPGRTPTLTQIATAAQKIDQTPKQKPIIGPKRWPHPLQALDFQHQVFPSPHIPSHPRLNLKSF